MIPAELRRHPGEIKIPDVVTERAYDLIVHRLADVVAVDQRRDPLLPAISDSGHGARQDAVRRGRSLPSLLAPQLETVRRLGTHCGGRVVVKYLGVKDPADDSAGLPPR